jgi:hypothetical protein
MKLVILNSLFLLLSGLLTAQTGNNSSTGFKPENKDVEQKKLESGINYNVNFDVANHEAYFVGGEDSLYNYLYKTIQIPQAAVDANLAGNAMIGFQVNFDGKIQGAYSIGKVGFGIDEQLVSAISALVFSPATQGNTPYRSEVVLEIPVKAVYLSNMKK